MHQSPDSVFDFEEWASLAKTDPQAFEARRQEEIARLIAQASPRMQTRLSGLQWKIDMERQRASNPMSSCMRIFDLMWDSVYGERGLLEALHGLEGQPLAERAPADVLNLRKPHPGRQGDKLPYPSTHP